MSDGKMKELLERVEAATGPDTELGYDIVVAFDAVPERGSPGYPYNVIASIDAALALVERVKPNCQWTIEPDACWLRIMGAEDVEEYQGVLFGRDGKCTAIAICAALLRSTLSEHPE